jgi:O-acetylhomoserine/O-acetylserine sulfhydrylase-like pyridoxal-dependent enzyme
MRKHSFRQETEAVHGGADLSKKNGPLSTPIFQVVG